MRSCGIFGPPESGKTTLARQLSREFWVQRKIPSLVLDPNGESWGRQAWVWGDAETFWPVVWSRRRHLVIIEEAAATIDRDGDLIQLFTRLRHLNHVLMVIGHDGTDLLPKMRRTLEVLYLFAQGPEAVKVWKKDLPTCQGIELAAQLKQFEFLRCKTYQKAKGMRLKLD